jgi:hypothetical protein
LQASIVSRTENDNNQKFEHFCAKRKYFKTFQNIPKYSCHEMRKTGRKFKSFDFMGEH